jgi:cell division transport system permease protein
MRRRNRAWLRRHSYSFFSSLGVLLQHRLGTLMTVLVLGIAMFLPLGLYVTLANLEGMNLRQEEWSAVTVYFGTAATRVEVEQLANQIEEKFHPHAVVMISPEQGMLEFQSASGFGASLEMLEENPLPWVMQISPQTGATEQIESRVNELTAYLQTIDGIDLVQFDHKWLQRLGRMMELGRAAVSMLILLFGLAVVVVVANTIRLDVATRAEEIEILVLVGAGSAFVRQPFLYSGLWYGLMASLLSIILLNLSLIYLGQPLALLLETYGSQFSLQTLGVYDSLLVVGGGGLLGWLGALISVQRFLLVLNVGGHLGGH